MVKTCFYASSISGADGSGVKAAPLHRLRVFRCRRRELTARYRPPAYPQEPGYSLPPPVGGFDEKRERFRRVDPPDLVRLDNLAGYRIDH